MVTLSAAVRENRLAGLIGLRDVLASRVEVSEPSETAALARQLREVLREIAELEKLVPKGSVVDDLAARRKTRHTDAAGDVPAVGDGEVERPGGR